MRKFGIWLLLLSSVSASAQTLPDATKTTVRDWLPACAANKASCDEVIGFIELIYTNNPNSTMACVPGDAQDNPSPPIVAWLKDHADAQDMIASRGILTAIRALYPCSARP